MSETGRVSAAEVVVRVPASSANLGPGFDALGMALTLHADVGVGVTLPDGAHFVDDRHPALLAFRRAGGEGTLWVRSPIPSGRGLGFSGAMRVGAVLAAQTQHGEADRESLLTICTELEGHADNVAASLLGGIVAVAGGATVRLPVRLDPAVVVWVPPSSTSTSGSRSRMSATVSRDDAVFNIGRTALLVAALAAGDVAALRAGCADRLHQDARLARESASRRALDAALDAGAWGAWLSGSGPAVAAWCAPTDAAALAAALPADGRVMVLHIDQVGATVQ